MAEKDGEEEAGAKDGRHEEGRREERQQKREGERERESEKECVRERERDPGKDQDFIMGFAGNSLQESRFELQLQPDVEMADAALYLNLC